jgi:hypothetical protein
MNSNQQLALELRSKIRAGQDKIVVLCKVSDPVKELPSGILVREGHLENLATVGLKGNPTEVGWIVSNMSDLDIEVGDECVYVSNESCTVFSSADLPFIPQGYEVRIFGAVERPDNCVVFKRHG